MKRFTRLFIAVIILIAVIFISVNMLLTSGNTSSGKQYKVEISRISNEISSSGLDNIKLENYPSIIAVTQIDGSKDDFSSEYNYELKKIDGKFYRFDYQLEKDSNNAVIIINLALAVMSSIIIVIFIYIRQRILKPFNTISSLPLELSKGNLNVPIKEQKEKYFGKFLWEIDLLREHLEQQKAKELQLQKEKKTLLLSLSHDIKTPLSIIELYAKALEKNLYKDEKRKQEIAQSITEKCNDIKEYVSEIVEASSKDFLKFDVNVQDTYVSDIIDEIKKLYDEKLELLKIKFTIESFSNCLIYADKNRAVEVLQNIIENAVKYGDGNEIKLSLKQEDNCILISVANSGCTLSDNELPHIFESFWRGSNVGSNNGSGLGLYICRKLMQEMGGEAFAELNGDKISIISVFRMI